MGLNAYKTLFTPEWVQAVKTAPESGMTATVRLYKEVRGAFDPSTNDYAKTVTEYYTGKARVQPMRETRFVAQPNDSASVQKVLVSFPIDDLLGVEVPMDAQLRVTKCVLNPVLTKNQFIITDLMDSSNPVERTFMFQVIQEVKV